MGYKIEDYSMSTKQLINMKFKIGDYPLRDSLNAISIMLMIGNETRSLKWTLDWLVRSRVSFKDPYLMHYVTDFSLGVYFIEECIPDVVYLFSLIIDNSRIKTTVHKGYSALDYFIINIVKHQLYIDMSEVEEMITNIKKLGLKQVSIFL